MAWLGGYIYEAHFVCHDILMLGKSPIKWRQRSDMTIAVDWDVSTLALIQTIALIPVAPPTIRHIVSKSKPML